MHKIFLCEDTPEGIFTGIYKAWEEGVNHTGVEVEGYQNMSLFVQYQKVVTDWELAQKVVRSVKEKISPLAYEQIYHATLCTDEDKAQKIYRYMRKGFRIGARILEALGDEDVLAVFEMDRQVSREAHVYLEIIRFEELQNHVLVARINPKCHVLPLIVEHFSDRLWQENWVILDTQRKISAVHMAKKGYFFTRNINEETLKKMKRSRTQQEMEKLWKCFFHSIAIDERKNEALQKQMMPLRYRKYMNEMTDEKETKKIDGKKEREKIWSKMNI